MPRVLASRCGHAYSKLTANEHLDEASKLCCRHWPASVLVFETDKRHESTGEDKRIERLGEDE